MSKADIWMPFFVGDYLADTMHLSRDQHGAYLLLLFAGWMRGGDLPDDDVELARIARASGREWSTLRRVLEPFFEIANGRWTQRRLARELAAANERRAHAAEKARVAAAKRWQGHQPAPAPSNAPSMNGARHSAAEDDAPSSAPSNARAMLEDCPPPSPVPKGLKKPTPVEEGSGEERATSPAPQPRTASLAAKTVRRRVGEGTRLPDDWRIPEEWVDWAMRAYPSLDRQRVVRMSVEFHRYWIAVPGQRGRKASWYATWQNRVASVMERGHG